MKEEFSWIYIHRRIFDDDRLGIKTKFIYILLCKYRQVTKKGNLKINQCNPSLEKLEKFVITKSNTIKYTHLKKLEKYNYIKINSVWGENDVYEILDIPSTKKANFVVLPINIIEDYDYTLYDKMTFFYLVRLKDNKTKTWWGGLRKLSSVIGCNHRKVKQALDNLIKFKDIKIVGTKSTPKINKHTGEVYHVNIYKVINWVETLKQDIEKKYKF